MHAIDNIVFIYTGKDLAKIAGVRSWDEDVVHGGDKRFRKENYDPAFQIAKPHLFEAILIRKQRAAAGLIQRLLQKHRTNQRMKKEPEHIEGDVEHKLYRAAVAHLGRDASPKDIVNDEVACVESLVTILRTLIVTFPFVTGTWSLYDVLRQRPDTIVVSNPQPGDIVLSVTGMGNGIVKNGHTGVVGLDGTIMSNDSGDGVWKSNYTVESWRHSTRPRAE